MHLSKDLLNCAVPNSKQWSLASERRNHSLGNHRRDLSEQSTAQHYPCLLPTANNIFISALGSLDVQVMPKGLVSLRECQAFEALQQSISRVNARVPQKWSISISCREQLSQTLRPDMIGTLSEIILCPSYLVLPPSSHTGRGFWRHLRKVTVLGVTLGVVWGFL